MKRILAVLSIWMVALGTIWNGHSDAYTVAIADMVCDESKIKSTKKNIKWTKSLSQSYARIQMQIYYPEWDIREHTALMKLWGKESAWNHHAKNPDSTAFGIPQLLNLNTKTPAPRQIERGLEYIKHRYGKPSVAWAHWENKNWY